MKKEFIICIFVILFIIVLNVVTQKHTEYVMDEIVENLDELREDLMVKNEDNIKGKINEAMRKMAR